MTDFVRIAVDAGVMTLTLNRPDKKNALNNAMYMALGNALNSAQTDPAVRVVVIQAVGDAFTAGNDLAEFAAVAAGTMDREAMGSNIFLPALARAQKPLIAAVQGLAVGVGVTMLLHCDFSYVAEDATLSTPFVNLGLVPEAASSWLMQARIGYARAYQLFALGEPMDGRTAAAIGLVTAAVSANAVQSTALATARKLAAKPLGALKATKQLMRDAATIEAVMNKERQVFGERLKTPEATEAFAAFAQKRKPDFAKFS
jgi:enoyl-CoA hydratase/carnithine racemase